MELCSYGRSEEYEFGGNPQCQGNIHEKREKFDDEVRRLIRLRSGLKKGAKYICDSHIAKYVTLYSVKHKHCVNPYETHMQITRKGTYEIDLKLRDKAKQFGLSLVPGQKLCVACKVRLFKALKEAGECVEVLESSPSVQSSQLTSSSTSQEDQGIVSLYSQPSPSCLVTVNKWLVDNNKDAIDFFKLTSEKSYLLSKLDDIFGILAHLSNLEFVKNSVPTWHQNSLYFEEFIKQLQNYVKGSEGSPDVLRALTVLPKSMPINMIQRIFDVSYRVAKRSKDLAEVRGLLSLPQAKEGRPLDSQIEEEVRNFYFRQDVSRELPGKNDVVSVKENGDRVKRRKRLLLGNISHIHDEFLKMFPHYLVSLSKFARLRPKECVPANKSGMHNICVCTYHENPKLMFRAANLANITSLRDATDCLKYFVCQDPSNDCYLRSCKACPDWSHVREMIEVAFDHEMVAHVTWNQWESTDRSNIVTLTDTVENFLDIFLHALEVLVTHHFTFKQQVQYYEDLKKNLKAGEAIVLSDFAENFTFVVQDSAQSLYFSSKQSTIHPFCVYYKNTDLENLQQMSFAVISDCMDHSTLAFYTFQSNLIDILKSKIENLNHIYYFSDGAGGQYKNRKIAANLWYHFSDFGIEAEWHYYATSHGKSPCDGIGGTIKRLATLYCLQQTKPGTQITTPKDLYAWAQKNIKGIHSIWVPKEEVAQNETNLEVRFKAATPIDGIKSSHCIIPVKGENFVLIKKFSAASNGEKREISRLDKTQIRIEDVRGFVTYWNLADPVWHLGYVEDITSELGHETIQVLTTMPTPEKNYYYEFGEDVVTLPVSQILTVVNPVLLSRGRVIRISATESKAADLIFKRKIK